MYIDSPDTFVIEHIVARLFPHKQQLRIEYVIEGVSTYVYRIHYANEVFYLRVLPEIGAGFAPEVTVHRLLREKQVKVPEVLYFEHINEELGQSIMLTSEIKGRHTGHCTQEKEQRAILLEAGRDLAIINSIPVQDFGWIRRDNWKSASLEAEIPTHRAYIYEHNEHDLGNLEEKVLTKGQVNTIRQILNHYDTWLDEGRSAWLAHGDFDLSHIYQDQGHYTGIIDFGEIRGVNSWYDLGHFRMHDGVTLPSLVLPFLIGGYQEVTPLPSDYEQKVCFSSLLIAIRTFAQALEKHPLKVHSQKRITSIQRDIELLLVSRYDFPASSSSSPSS